MASLRDLPDLARLERLRRAPLAADSLLDEDAVLPSTPVAYQDQEPTNEWHRRAIHKTVLDEFYRIAFPKKL